MWLLRNINHMMLIMDKRMRQTHWWRMNKLIPLPMSKEVRHPVERSRAQWRLTASPALRHSVRDVVSIGEEECFKDGDNVTSLVVDVAVGHLPVESVY